jgi:hypothetical protein
MNWRALALSVSVCLLATPATSSAADVGRYQAIPLPKVQNQLGDMIMILDTSTGDLWEWWVGPAIGDSKASEGVVYIGKMTPGSAPGEIRPIERFYTNPKKSN